MALGRVPLLARAGATAHVAVPAQPGVVSGGARRRVGGGGGRALGRGRLAAGFAGAGLRAAGAAGAASGAGAGRAYLASRIARRASILLIVASPPILGVATDRASPARAREGPGRAGVAPR